MDATEQSRIAELMEATTIESLVALADDAMREDLGLDCRRVGGGVVVRMRAAPFVHYFTRAVALGITEAFTADVLAEVTALLRDAGGQALPIMLAPAQETDEVVAMLERAGWVRDGTWAKMIRAAGPIDPPSTSLRIAQVPSQEATEFGRILIESMQMPPVMTDWAARQVVSAGYTAFGAYDGDQLVGVGVLLVKGEVAQLAGAATLPAYRGRGGQLALMAARINAATEQGATWITAETGSETPDNPNPSLHNMARAGMDLLYHRRNWLLHVDR